MSRWFKVSVVRVVFKNSLGFSLIELLVTLSIVVLLFAFGVMAYDRIKKQNRITWMKQELIEVSRIMKVAKAQDGYYHQFLHQMGYEPKGLVYASVGIGSDVTSHVCCNKYTSDFIKTGLLYYHPHGQKTTDNIGICNSLSQKPCIYHSSLGSSPRSLNKNDFRSDCKNEIPTWCNCHRFTIGSVGHYKGEKIEITLNEVGELCIDGKKIN